MKQIMARTLASLMLIVGGLSVTAHAQSKSIMKASIPFTFTLGNKSFPAGDYVLERTHELLILRDSQGNALVQLFTVGADGPKAITTPKLRFYSENGALSLAEIVQPDQTPSEQVVLFRHRAQAPQYVADQSRETTTAGRP